MFFLRICSLYNSGITVFMLLVQLLQQTVDQPQDSRLIRDRKGAATRSWAAVQCRVCSILLASYEITLRHADGRSALHVLVDSAAPSSAETWPYQLASVLLELGADPNEADQTGLTPLLKWAATVRGADDPLFLRHNADINAQGPSGRSVIHRLVSHKATTALTELGVSGFLSQVYWSLRSASGETAVQLARRKYCARRHDAAAHMVLDMVAAQEERWQSYWQHVRSAVHEHMPLDLCHIALGYVDGSDPPKREAPGRMKGDVGSEGSREAAGHEAQVAAAAAAAAAAATAAEGSGTAGAQAMVLCDDDSDSDSEAEL
jgi:hypothetical protein